MTKIVSLRDVVSARDVASIRDVVTSCLLGVLLLLGSAPARAQAPAQDQTLDRIQNLIATGRFTEAGNTLERWEREHGDPRSSAGPGDRARALYLRGVLSSDAQEAEDAFVGVVLSYPSSAAAPDALLRLGQALLTAGDARRATAYLERLRSDYPGAPARETGLLWLARAQLAGGMGSAACATVRAALAQGPGPNLRTLLELEQDKACSGAPVPPSQQSVPPPAGVRQQPPPPPQAPPAQTGRPTAASVTGQQPSGDYAVQTGAYRELSSAENIAQQMRTRGFDVRVVLVGDSPLYRVRFGDFENTEEAHAAADRIRRAGFAVIVVSDVRAERR
ncbi:MAG TPA: SPOR domain-containing protein [Longimicrobiales bacterium]|nr:SPOR domain-containing protein [Longimicrobiales bacterium]